MERGGKASQRSNSMPAKERRVQFLRQQSVEVTPTIKKTLVRANTVAGTMQDNVGVAGSVMDALVICTVCSQRLSSPKMLPCQHTFCQACLEARNEEQTVQCPTCGVEVMLSGEVADLPTNLYLNTLLTALAGREFGTPAMQEERCVKCQTVGKGPICQHCHQMFCLVCWSSHVTELRAQLGSLTEQLQAAGETLKHRVDDFKDRCEKLHEHIEEAVEVKIAALGEQRSSLEREVRELETQSDRSAGVLHNKLLIAENNVSFLAFDNVTDNTEKVSLFLLLHSTTSDLLNDVSRWDDARPTLDRDTLKIHYQEDDEVTADDDDGDPDEVDVDVDRKHEAQVSSPDGLSLFYRSRSMNAPRLSINKNRLQRPAGLGVAPWNDALIYVAGTDNGSVVVLDRVRGRLVTRLTAPDMACPQGVAFSASRLYVTDKWNHRIHVFNMDGGYVCSYGKKGEGNGQLRSPEGICARVVDVAGVVDGVEAQVDDNVLLYVCDTGNDRLQVLRAHDGSFVNYIGLTGKAVRGKLVTELYQPTGVAVNEGTIVVSDSGNRRIKTYTLSGVKTAEFGSHGGGSGQFRSPECLAVDRLGFILVGDSGNARIQIFRPNGNLVRTIGGRRAGAWRFGWISGLAITDNRDIIVADSKHHCVQIF